MAVDTIMTKIDTMPQATWQAVLDTVTDTAELVEAKTALLSLAENAEALLALLEGSGET